MNRSELKTSPELVREAVSGSLAALEAILISAWPHAYRLAFFVTKDHELAEDVAQEAAIVAGLRIRSLRDADSFASWFGRVVFREALRARRRKHRSVPLREMHAIENSCPSDSLDMRSAIFALPESLRLPLVLTIYLGFAGKEAAATLGVSEGAVRVRVHRAKGILRDHLIVAETPNRSVAI